MSTDLTELLRRIDDAIDNHDHDRALRLVLANWNNLQDTAVLRERVALVLATTGNKRKAAEIYDVVARHYANAGFPTRSLAATKQMLELNPSSSQLLDQFVTLYSVRSPFLERNLDQKQLPDPVDDLVLGLEEFDDETDLALTDRAFEAATQPDNIAERPGSLPSLPLMSLLPPSPLRRLLDLLEYEIYAESQPIIGPDVESDGLVWAVSSDLVIPDEEDSPLRVPPGTLFGLNAFGTPTAAPTVTVVSQQGSECLRLSDESIEQLAEEFPDFHNRLATLFRHGLTEGIFDDDPMFADLDDQLLEDLPGRLTGLRLEDETVLVRQNKISPGLYIILEGNIDVVRRQNGQTTTIETLQPGQMAGEIGLIDPRPVPATAVTSGPAHVLFLDRERFIELADDNPTFAEVARRRADDKTERIRAAT